MAIFAILILSLNVQAETNDYILVSQCPKEVVEVEVIKYVEVKEYIEIEVPVYLPDGSSSVWDNSAAMLYLYDIDVFEGPKRTNQVIPYAVFKHIDDVNFKLVDWKL
jgi:hypothetical protein